MFSSVFSHKAGSVLGAVIVAALSTLSHAHAQSYPGSSTGYMMPMPGFYYPTPAPSPTVCPDPSALLSGAPSFEDRVASAASSSASSVDTDLIAALGAEAAVAAGENAANNDEDGLPKGPPSNPLNADAICSGAQDVATKACQGAVDGCQKLIDDHNEQINKALEGLRKTLEEVQRWLPRLRMALGMYKFCGGDPGSLPDQIKKGEEQLAKILEKMRLLEEDRMKFMWQVLNAACDGFCGSRVDKTKPLGRIAYGVCMSQCQVRNCPAFGSLVGLGCRMKFMPYLQQMMMQNGLMPS